MDAARVALFTREQQRALPVSLLLLPLCEQHSRGRKIDSGSLWGRHKVEAQRAALRTPSAPMVLVQGPG
jgi:hypothetical protein